jgi:hypothetical protein
METPDTASHGLEAGPVKSALPVTQAAAANGHRASHGSLSVLGDGQTLSAIAPAVSPVFDADAFDAEILQAGHFAGGTPDDGPVTETYIVSGAAFSDGSALTGTFAVEYSSADDASATGTIVEVDLTTEGTTFLYNVPGQSDNTAVAFTNNTNSDYPDSWQSALFDSDARSDLALTWLTETPTTLAIDGSTGSVADTTYVEGATFPPNYIPLADGGTIETVCYLRGTHILTPTGETRVETLKIGDLVVTRFGGIRPILWIGRQTFERDTIAGDREKLPVRIRAGALGPQQPAADLYVSPGHSMLIDGHLVLAKALVNGITITQELPAASGACIDYYNPELDTHDCVIAEGAFAETFADGPGLRCRFHNAASYADLYPDAPPATQLRLCAPRPERGETLAALVRPIVERASHGIVPGPLRGAIDLITLPDRIDVWAQDTAHPLLPVTLEILLGDRVIGTSVALDHRADLEAAGVGNGRASLSFTCPVAITPEAVKSLRVRRASDGAELAMTEACRASLSVSIGLRKAA